ncbi:hypothetical protein [Thauera linaloolentis]|uniref:Uncharacterized protein n=1 Tax=Thauera linaloolentis (strain DSM 12138 / JCM 21573 / CCUG 41526 / CIP 105981 / IAM 15112 / NBRC 102519 / 47Lol) TaxID=1123367 RepID=N6YUF7_THAL4|nr:hypothetical protein [Thauera linaloolentis]ENO83604.1 hypothetical protein C666_18665 [Thauera linaloolentis 47Lol = DSM 12138]MCM8567723.1 hypothetical protein [Thauera linaloolentis]
MAHGSYFSSKNDATAAWQALLGQVEAVRRGWLDDGLLVTPAELARAWGQAPSALEALHERGELFRIRIGRGWYYPAAFKSLEEEEVIAVCRALRGDDTSAKFIFWNRRHSGLDGLTVAEALRGKQAAKVRCLAAGWSAERGLMACARMR